MDTFEKSIYLSFPTMTRSAPKENTFKGTFDLSGDRGLCFVTFFVPNYPSASGISYKTGLTFPTTDVETLKLASDSINFLEYLKLFEQLVTKLPEPLLLNKNSFEVFYNDLIALRDTYKNSVQCRFDRDNQVLTITNCATAMVQSFKLKIDFLTKHSYRAEVVDCDLPQEKNKKLFKSTNNIIQLYEQFLRIIEALEVFYETMHKIDTICWVLDPSRPSPAHNYRRIVIDTDVSVELVFDPFNMIKAPKFKFFGPSRLTEPHILKLSENLEDWDPEYDIVHNILKILDLPFFPLKPEEDATKSNGNLLYDSSECCVCFSYILNEKTPDIICSNASCTVHFHSFCLYEWLTSLPMSQIIFSQIHGTCPNCEEAISCPVPEKEIRR